LPGKRVLYPSTYTFWTGVKIQMFQEHITWMYSMSGWRK
jgi:hypothetical protein